MKYKQIAISLSLPVLLLAALGMCTAWNILRYGLESVTIIMTDADAGSVRDQRMILREYENKFAVKEPEKSVKKKS